jgi:hypothetical protein
MPATYEPIATTTLGTAASSITFSSITSSYTDLRVVLVVSGADAYSLNYTFNGDTATNYSFIYLLGNGTSASSNRIGNNANLGTFAYNTNIIFHTLDVFSYAGSTFKTALGTISRDENGSGQVWRYVGLWRSTSAITSISINSNVTFAAGTTATLYGIKNA